MTFERTITIKPTPEEMAEVFANWMSWDQAKFLDLVATKMNEWQPHARCMQCAYIRQDMTDHAGTQFDAFELVAELTRVAT